ncbi:MAG: hypothetical protein HRU41_10040 [Saprospiraceae bacterium]|nr:hypothetical protein [Saprospiraceae bacterium]
MKSCIKILLLLSFTVILQGCADSCEKLSLAYDYYEAKELHETVKELERIKTSVRKNGLLYKEISLFEGRVYLEMDSLDMAEQAFKEVLAGTGRAKQATRMLKKKLPSIDPYTKLYYDANMNLARIYTGRKKYQQSLGFIQKADEESDYFGCLFGKLDDEFQRDTLFVRNQLELGRVNPILERLKGDIFNLSTVKNYWNINDIASLLKEQYSPDEISKALSEVVSSIEKRETLVEEVIQREYHSSWFGYEVRVLGLNTYNYVEGYYYDYEIEIDSITGIPFTVPKTEEELMQIVQAKIMESEIYVALQE